ncbi:hypothetical protein A2501_04260 [Candidatus Uhrbacteria bacterium RIFOXYC12_FULL_57_11]|nr:MAG: hypothetical protein A2501_04260 [Candidatus Uhrbacteria bacterium RIFOXYC12_FULL_57_11]
MTMQRIRIPPGAQLPVIPVEGDVIKPLEPKVPTVVLGAFKGGDWKTAVAVALAEMLAWGGLHVLVLTPDQQFDAHRRFGVGAKMAVPKLTFGPGSVTVMGANPPRTAAIIYQGGEALKGIDLVIVDNPPMVDAARLPGVLVVVPVGGRDGLLNAVPMLRLAPESSGVVFLRVADVDGRDQLQWKRDVKAVIEELGMKERAAFYPVPVPYSKPVKRAHDAGLSVWRLTRSGNTMEFLRAIRSVGEVVWKWAAPGRTMHRIPAPDNYQVIGGVWDGDE